MTTIRLHNTRTRRKEVFEPLDPKNVRMYVCGPTVYDRAHLGNARAVVVFDVLFRLLRHVAEEKGWEKVTYVRNFTDVDDKINARAAETGRPIREITDETIRWYHEDMDALGALRPTHEPRATEYIEQMKALIQVLIDRKHAYVVREPSNDPPQEYVIFDHQSYDQGHALFDIESYPEYGQLSGRSLEDMIAGARVEVAPYKRHPADFVLWKPSDEALPGWDSPWGRGRPGWHIECSAMARELLGTSFDIHGGGMDLQFPHHENEIAQSECSDPGAGFARVWMHNEMLQVEGKKMSKSLGNFFTVRDLLDQGLPGEVIRFVLLGTHYGKPMDWTDKKAKVAVKVLDDWYRIIGDVEGYPSERLSGATYTGVEENIADDLNTPDAISRLHYFAEVAHKRADEPAKRVLKTAANLLGLLEMTASEWFGNDANIGSLINQLVEARERARTEKNYRLADEIRSAFREAGIRVSDGGEGTTWSIERDELDSTSFIREVRSAFLADDEAKLKFALDRANEAGLTFANLDQLDLSPVWRGPPSEKHIRAVLSQLARQVGGSL